MTSAIEPQIKRSSPLVGLLPLVVFCVGILWVGFNWPPWLLMWSFALAMYLGLKWLSFADCLGLIHRPTLGRTLGYLLLWPGMNAKAFLTSSRPVERPQVSEWLLSVAKMILGLVLIAVSVLTIGQHPYLAGCVGLMGIIFSLHFGLLHLLSVVWRWAGVDARPIMNAPILASSLGEFWGKRWNLAFRDLAHAHVFRPLAGRIGAARATIAVFITSGIVHDLVISLPARGGWGLPTLYFVIQGVGVLFEHSRLAKKLGLQKGAAGRLFCAFVTLGPMPLLFHRPFVERVVVPMFEVLRNTIPH